MEARVKDEDDAAEASDSSAAFTVRCQGVEHAWELAGVTRDTSAHELKALLEAASGIEQGSVRLIHQGRVLADDASLGSAGVHPGACTVHVAVRPPGVSATQAAAPTSADAQPGAGLRDEDLVALRAALEAELRAMAAQPAPFGRRARDGDISDFALGCAVGLLLGFAAMMCLLEPTASRRMRAGLFLGVCLNISGAFAKFSDNGRQGRSEW